MNNQRVTILGEHNVGKSSIYTWLTGDDAMISSVPGTTVDYHEAIAHLDQFSVKLVDTPGYSSVEDSAWSRIVKLLASTSGPVLWVFKPQQALTIDHYAILDQLRKLNKVVIIAINGPSLLKNKELYTEEVFQLPVNQIISISSRKEQGLAQISAALKDYVSHEELATSETKCLLTIIGKPNVGKSTLVNSLLGYQRSLISPVAGTTQGPVKAFLDDLAIVDTAGLHKSTSSAQQRKFKVPQSVSAANVIAVVFDATEGLAIQDLRLASLAAERGKPILFIANKIDLVKDKRTVRTDLKYRLQDSFAQVADNNLICISAKHKIGTKQITRLVEQLYRSSATKVDHRKLNEWLKNFQENCRPVLVGGRLCKLKYLVQKAVCPPQFLLFVNAIPPVHHQRYVKHSLAKQFGLQKIPLWLEFKKNLNPYVTKNE